MPLPTTISDLFTSAASNSPSGGESPILTDDYMRLFAAFIAQLRDGQGFLTAVRSNSLGSVSVPAFSFVGDTDTGAWSPAADTYAVSTGGAERMRIAAAGNVTIATPSSGTALSINSLSSNYGIVCTDGTINTYIGLASSGASYNGVLTNHAYILRTNNTDRITVAAAGNVTIAAPSSGTALAVKAISSTLLSIENTTGTIAAISLADTGWASAVGTTSGDLWFSAGGSTIAAEKMRLTTAGNVGIGRTPTVKLDANGAMALSSPTQTSAANYTVLAGDSSVRCSAACTITLPAAASFNGRILTICNVGAFAIVSASANVYPIGTATAGTAILAATSGKVAQLQSDGAFWVTLMAN